MAWGLSCFMRRAGPNRPTTHTSHGSMNFYIEVIYTKESSDPENRRNTPVTYRYSTDST